MDRMNFIAKIILVSNCSVIRLPNKVSNQLPSRGMNMAKVKIGDYEAIVGLEPDGQKGHCFILDESLPIRSHEDINVELEIITEWIDPLLPDDMLTGLESHELSKLWHGITVKAKWEWLRFIRSTKSDATRKKRIASMIDMLEHGKKRPCCYDSSKCSYSRLSVNGILLTDKN